MLTNEIQLIVDYADTKSSSVLYSAAVISIVVISEVCYLQSCSFCAREPAGVVQLPVFLVPPEECHAWLSYANRPTIQRYGPASNGALTISSHRLRPILI